MAERKDRRRYRRASKARFFDSLSQAFVGRIDRLEHLIGDAHWPSVGESREFLLREFLREFLPERLAVSAGFILFEDPDRAVDEGTDSVLRPSPQLDIIVWDRLNYAPHFKAGEFVVVPPGAVELVILVKSTLGSTELRDDLARLVDVSVAYDDLRSVVGYDDVRTPPLILFGWRPPKTKTKSGEPSRKQRRRMDQVVRSVVRKALAPHEEDGPLTYYFPPVAVFLYAHWAVLLRGVLEESDRMPVVGYQTVPTRQTVGDDGEKDFTMSALLQLVAQLTGRDDHLAWFRVHRPGRPAVRVGRIAVLARGDECDDYDPASWHADLDEEDSDDEDFDFDDD